MTSAVNRFYSSLKESASISDRALVGLFAYFMTVEDGQDVATAKAIADCFKNCDLSPPARIPAYLSEGVAAKQFVKVDGGYKLQRHYREQLSAQIGAGSAAVQTSADLRKLEGKIVTASEKAFLKETIDCYEAGANRATIIMCWILALDHICEFVFKKHLVSFNSELAKVTDKRVKVSEIKTRDDFSDVPENKLIELMRSAGIISNDVRKILEQKLGIRNSCAHPSGIAVKPSKVVEFVDDLIENVVLKYPI